MSTIAKVLPTPPDNFSTQIASSTVSSTALTVQLDSVAGLPTEGVGQFFKKDASGAIIPGSIEFVHWTNIAGSSITFTDTGDRGITGSDSGAQSYVADDYFEVWVSSYYSSNYSMDVEHNSDGTHDNTKVPVVSGGYATTLTTTASTNVTLPTTGTLATESYVDAATASSGTDGWTAATGTWTYASATTITVPSGAASLYQKGDKFKLTANSVVLYGYIITVADTLLTVRGDALTNHAFTANYFSKQDNPQGFPTSFAYTPTITGYGTPPSTPFARFHMAGTIVYLQIATGNATSNANTLTVSLPVTAKTLSGATWRNKPSNLVDNGTNSTTADFVFIDSAATVAALAKNTSSTGFTSSGSKGVDFQIWYEI